MPSIISICGEKVKRENGIGQRKPDKRKVGKSNGQNRT